MATRSTGGMRGAAWVRVVTRLVLIAVIASSFMVPSGVSAATGTVVATESVNIRACAAVDCPVIGAAALGDEIEITGALTNGYYPVRWFGQDGFAYALYLSQGGPAPWLVEGNVSCHQVALTFNIGIGYPPSQSILNTLVQQDVDATMFPMGWWAEEHPDYLRALDDAGFSIGTHGDQILFLTDATDAVIRQDVSSSVAAIESVIGRPIERYHTPYAADTDGRVRSVVSEMGFLPVGWNVSAADYADWATEDAVYNRVMNNVYPGAVIEFHLDGPATERSTARALPRIIQNLRAEGYELVTVPDLAEPCLGTQSDQTGATATVVNTGGDGLNCRVAPGTPAARITTLSAGAKVTARGETFNGWVPIECGGQNGWSSGTYLSVTSIDPEPEPDPEPDPPPAQQATGTVVNTGGSGLNCRSGPSTGYGVITVLGAGATVTVRGGDQGGWYPVVCGGRDGWVSGSYLSVSSSQPAPTPTPVDPAPEPTPPPGDASTVGTVSNTGGDGLNCRTGRSTSFPVITVLPAGTTVTVRGAAEAGWVPVRCAGQDGWVSASYLTVANATPGEDTGIVTTGGLRANCRSQPSLSGTIITSLANGTEVIVRGAASNGWVPIRCANSDGWIYGELIRGN